MSGFGASDFTGSYQLNQSLFWTSGLLIALPALLGLLLKLVQEFKVFQALGVLEFRATRGRSRDLDLGLFRHYVGVESWGVVPVLD